MPLKTNYRNISWNGLRKYQIIQNQDGTVSFLDVTEYTNVQDAKVLANDLNTNNDLVNRIMAGEFFYTEVETDALLAQKQNVLSFDNLPTANSGNPVRSDGIKYALDLINSRIDNLKVFAIYVCQSGEYDPDTLVPTIQNPDTETFYLVPSGTGSDVFTEWIYINNHWEIFGSSQIDMSNYVTVTDLQDALDDKQDVLTFDNVPTANSDNPVKSGGVKSALDGKSDTGHNHDDRYYTDSETDILLSGKSDTGHNHDDRYYTETEVDVLLDGKRNVSDSYTKTQVDTLLSAKSDNIHNHDDRYYTETEVDTLVDDLQDQIDAINNFAIHICSSSEYDPDTLIPTIQNPNENTFYLVPDGSGYDMYNEWVYLNSAWEKFGSTRIDLSQYYTKSQTDVLLARKADSVHVHDDRYYTESETDTLLAGKSDSGHNHDGRYYTESETDALLAGKAAAGHDHDGRYYTESETDALLAGKSDSGHNHDSAYSALNHVHDDRYYTESETDTLLAGKSDSGHNHDDRYYTESETDTLLAGKAAASHDHDGRYYTESETDALLAGKSDSGHDHDGRYYTESETDTLLAGKSDTGHTHSNYVQKAGDTMTGSLNIASAAPELSILRDGDKIVAFKAADGTEQGAMWVSNNSHAIGFRSYDNDYSHREIFYLPSPGSLTANATYYILTTKTPVTLAQGGTGGTDSGWQSYTDETVFTGTIYYRKVGAFFMIMGQAIKLVSTLTAGHSVSLMILPTEYKPSKEIMPNCFMNTSAVNNRIAPMRLTYNGVLYLYANKSDDIESTYSLYFSGFGFV